MNYLVQTKLKLAHYIFSYDYLLVRLPNIYFLRKALFRTTIDICKPWLIITDNNNIKKYWDDLIATLGLGNSFYTSVSYKKFISVSGYYELKLPNYNIIVDCYKSNISIRSLKAIRGKADKVIFIDRGYHIFTEQDIIEVFPKLHKYNPSYRTVLEQGLIPKAKVILYKIQLAEEGASEKIYLTNSITSRERFHTSYTNYRSNPKNFDDINLTLSCTSRQKYEYLLRSRIFIKKKVMDKYKECSKESRKALKNRIWTSLRKLNTYLSVKKLGSLIGIKKLINDKKVIFFLDSATKYIDLKDYFRAISVENTEFIDEYSSEEESKAYVTQFKAGLRNHVFTNDVAPPRGLTWSNFDVVVLVKPVLTIIRNLNTLFLVNPNLKIIMLELDNTIDNDKVDELRKVVAEEFIFSTNNLGSTRELIYEN